jgi:3-hydroxyacyl-CoA dehydrogenase
VFVADSAGTGQSQVLCRPRAQPANLRIVELGEDPRTVDAIAVQGLRIPKGPLQDIDEAGATAVLLDIRAVNEELGEARLVVPDMLASMADHEERFFLRMTGHPMRGLDDLVQRAKVT